MKDVISLEDYLEPIAKAWAGSAVNLDKVKKDYLFLSNERLKEKANVNFEK